MTSIRWRSLSGLEEPVGWDLFPQAPASRFLQNAGTHGSELDSESNIVLEDGDLLGI